MHVDQGVSRYFLLLGLVVPSKGRGVAGLARPLATVRLSDDDVLSIHRILLRGSVGSPQAGRGGRLLIGVKSDGSHAPEYGADTLWALLSFREGMSLDELGNYGI